ncbi:unnamed protein product, partial [Tetraodon nigroviridis]
NFPALQLGTVVPPARQATFECSFIPAEPMGGRPFGCLLIWSSSFVQGNVFQDAVFNQTVTVTEKEDGLDGETCVSPAFPPLPPLSVLAAVILILLLFFLLLSIFTYVFLSALGLLILIGLHQLLESRKRRRPAPKVEMGTSSHDGVDLSWIPQETLNQIS